MTHHTQRQTFKKPFSSLRRAYSMPEFASLTEKFQKECERVIGETCKLTITFNPYAAFDQHKMDIDICERISLKNEKDCLLKTSSTDGITKDAFLLANHIIAEIQPETTTSQSSAPYAALRLSADKKSVSLYASGLKDTLKL